MRIGLSALLVGALVLAACAPQGGRQSPTSSVTQPTEQPRASTAGGGTLRIGLRTETDILDPHVVRDASAVAQLRNVYEPLVDIDASGQLTPVLASSWQASADARTFTFRLRANVKFSDGAPFDAEAAKFSIERLQKMKKGNFPSVESVEKVEALAPDTLRISLKEPYAPFLRGLWLVWMVSPTSVQKNTQGEDFGEKWLNANTAGTGPYKLESRNRGSEMVLSRHEGYWGGWLGDHFDKVVLKVVNEAATQRLMLERGDLDISLLFTPEAITAFRSNPAIEVASGPLADQLFILLQMADGTTTKPQVRQALNYVWDAESYATLMQGTMGPSKGPLSEILQKAAGMKVENPYRLDLERARQLLAEAGHPDGRGLRVQIWTHQPDVKKKVMAELFQAQLAKVGVKADIQTAEWPAIRKTVVDFAKAGDAALRKEAMPFNIISRLGDPRELFRLLWHSKARAGAGNNYMNYSNPQVDRLIDESLRTYDEKEANRLIQEAANIVMRDAPAVFAASSVGFVPMRKQIKGYVHRPIMAEMLRYYELHR